MTHMIETKQLTYAYPREEGEPLRTPRVDYSGGFLPSLVELSDVLPPEIYNCEDLE